MTDPSDVRRRDEDGDFHQLQPATCQACGCTYYTARDEPSLVWEPGSAWEEACRDAACHCHSQPVIGARRA